MSAANYTPTYDRLGDVRIFLTPEGAAYVAQMRAGAPSPCMETDCPDDRRSDGDFCDVHDLVDAF